MHLSAVQTWYRYIKKHEGEVAHMYLDTRGLVTVGVGNLIDPISLARALPFQFKPTNRVSKAAGQPATGPEIEAEWNHLKNHLKREEMKVRGHRLCEPETNLELSELEVARLFTGKSAANEERLRQTFDRWSEFPADAQLAVMAMAWGLGAGAGISTKFPKFAAACKSMDFEKAARQSHISTWRPERNEASVRLLQNAACVLRNPAHYTVSTLYYPLVIGDAVAVV
jgi:hypothetical protein